MNSMSGLGFGIGTLTRIPLPANVPEYFAVTSGQVLNFISTSTSTGYVCLTEMT